MSDSDLRERKRAWESDPSAETEAAYFGALARAGQLPTAAEVRERSRWKELVSRLDDQLAAQLPPGPLPVEEERGISRAELVSALALAGDQEAIQAAIQAAAELLGRELPSALAEAYLLLYSLPTFCYGNQDHICWPTTLEIDRRSERGPVAVFAHENQNVVLWGFWLDTSDEDPEILITFEDTFWRTTSTRLVESLTQHLRLPSDEPPYREQVRERLSACGVQPLDLQVDWPPVGLPTAVPDCSIQGPTRSCWWCAPAP